MRAEHLFGFAFVLCLASIAGGCAEDPYNAFPRRKQPVTKGDGNDNTNKTQSGALPGDGEGEEEEEESADAGPPVDAAPAITAFSNTSPYALLTPAKQSEDHHGGVSHAGEDCLLCHTGQGAPKFAIAGTVFSTKAASGAAIGAQVRIISAAGDELALVGTDAAGNFWLKAAITIPPGSRVGVRDGAKTKLMGAAIGTGACNQSGCHISTRPIYLND